MLLRNFYIILMLLYTLFCLPCFCIDDNCWLKRKMGVKNNGVDKQVFSHLKKAKWSYDTDKDFDDFAQFQALKNRQTSLKSPLDATDDA